MAPTKMQHSCRDFVCPAVIDDATERHTVYAC